MSRVEGPISQHTKRVLMQRAMANAASRVEEVTRDDNEWIVGDTPIERALFAALALEIDIGQQEMVGWDIVKEAFDKRFVFDTHAARLKIWPQAEVNGWRVDFVIGIQGWKDRPSFLIIECDGHDFHERTKGQARRDRSRDRDAQAAGFKIFRFTGSEIHKDPCVCADAILDWAAREYCF